MTWTTNICFALLALAVLLALARLLIGPSLADRVVAADLILTLTAISAAVATVRTGNGTYLRIMLIVAVVGFLGTTMAAKFIEDRGT